MTKDENDEGLLVSIWVGSFDTKESFESYMAQTVESRRVDFGPRSEFAIEFSLSSYSEDFQEAYSDSNATSLRDVLSGMSYSSSYIDQAVSLAELFNVSKSNSAVLRFDYRYDPPEDLLYRHQRMTFIGTFEYDPKARATAELK